MSKAEIFTTLAPVRVRRTPEQSRLILKPAQNGSFYLIGNQSVVELIQGAKFVEIQVNETKSALRLVPTAEGATNARQVGYYRGYVSFQGGRDLVDAGYLTGTYYPDKGSLVFRFKSDNHQYKKSRPQEDSKDGE